MDINELLVHFNLTRQEATIYTTLYAEGELTGYEVAKLTGISRSNTYTSLAGLVEKGAAYVIEGTATRYTPVRIEDFCDNKIRQLQQIKQDLLKGMPSKREETDGYITIKGEKHILEKMRNMVARAKERVYLSVARPTLSFILAELKDGLARGLKIVIITNHPFELAGAIVYHAEKPPHQIRLIVDSSNVLTGDIADGDFSTCLYSKKKNLVELIKESIKNEITLIDLTKGQGS
ncbi:TrmB family transcriptional regulator [Desulforamulus aeronauticus]|uniref:Sugar-specific transcriptional regulator TrmB n=1 Tax=Desulforamulus aeronauticus DSM 10349 TaxID=1121421 RepID=A0A1M6TF73_9FIRM|nr:TrmB family transcriptional regulator [Desulforamulus aeronauticus]SHK55486.1 Sugar-specific transcriptional regulator TrmB [Desulforamulus aeronauticus DSM 10349]